MTQNFPDRVVFRPARKDECRTIARLYSISSDGLADYIRTPAAINQHSRIFSFRNTGT